MPGLIDQAEELHRRAMAAPYCRERRPKALALLRRAFAECEAVLFARERAQMMRSATALAEVAIIATEATLAATLYIAEARELVESIEADAREMRKGIPC